MKPSRFFRILWRIDIVVIAVAGGLAVFGMTYLLLFEIGRDLFGRPYATEVVDLAEQREDRATFAMGRFEEVEGAGVLRAPLTSSQDTAYGAASSYGSTSATRNYLFYDPRARAGRWLNARNDWLFVSSAALREPGKHDGVAPVRAFLYEVVDADTDGNGKLTGEDRSSLALSDPTGTNCKIVKRGIDDLLDSTVLSPTSAAVFYMVDREMRAMEVSLSTLDVVHDDPVAKLPPKKIGS